MREAGLSHYYEEIVPLPLRPAEYRSPDDKPTVTMGYERVKVWCITSARPPSGSAVPCPRCQRESTP